MSTKTISIYKAILCTNGMNIKQFKITNPYIHTVGIANPDGQPNRIKLAINNNNYRLMATYKTI